MYVVPEAEARALVVEVRQLLLVALVHEPRALRAFRHELRALGLHLKIKLQNIIYIFYIHTNIINAKVRLFVLLSFCKGAMLWYDFAAWIWLGRNLLQQNIFT